ncbi:hypothetical protein HAX54_020711, partial [Datura stramonium]|nr:hypothetical protein [Datura stramonium]
TINLNDPPSPIVINELSEEKEGDESPVIWPSEVQEDQSNILQCEVEIIEEFIEVMNKERDGGGEGTPNLAGEKDSPARLSSPKWDGTPNPTNTTVAPSQTLMDDDVPLNLMFNKEPRSSYKHSSMSRKGTHR